MKKVAIVGVEGSGKTVMLAGLGDLYTYPAEQGYFLSPKNFSTAAYVSEKIARMRKGEWPAATAGDELQGLDWTLRRQTEGGRGRPANICEVSFLDFPGEVYRAAYGISGDGDASLKEQAEELKQYVCGADELMVLINLRDVITSGLRDQRVQEAMWITKSILDTALGDADNKNAPRAAIVLSQADSYAETIKACGGPKGVLARYLPHVANEYGWLDVLAASAVDKTLLDDNGNMVPAPDFQTTWLRVIMNWIRCGIQQKRQEPSVPFANAPIQHAHVPPTKPHAPLPVARTRIPAARNVAAKARNRLSFLGRATRLEYWQATLSTCAFLVVVAFVLLFVLKGLSDARVVRGWVGGHLRYNDCLPVAFALMYFASILGGIALLPVSVRRLHDQGVSGWVMIIFIVLGLFPCLQLIGGLSSFVWLGCLPGTRGPNQYGPDPLAGR